LDQAVARLHRAGQLRGVNVSLLAVARSVDARVADVLARKREIIHDIIERTA
jgi:SNF2 family DNA or RNA helicase